MVLPLLLKYPSGDVKRLEAWLPVLLRDDGLTDNRDSADLALRSRFFQLCTSSSVRAFLGADPSETSSPATRINIEFMNAGTYLRKNNYAQNLGQNEETQ